MKKINTSKIKFPVTFGDWLETEQGKQWKMSLIQSETKKVMDVWRLHRAFSNPNLKVLCDSVFGVVKNENRP